MLMFLRNGEPKSSVSTMLMNDRKPRPMNSGEPHLVRNLIKLSFASKMNEEGLREGTRSGDIWAKLEEPTRRARVAVVRAAAPVRDAGAADKGGADHQDHRAYTAQSYTVIRR